ncbi:MAG: glycosyltransferase, partial [Acidimicrobiales bacterium]
MLALSRELRNLGHHATVLAPLDHQLDHQMDHQLDHQRAKDRDQRDEPDRQGSDDDHSIVGLGRSVRVRANGSVAPVALGPAASVRAVMALRAGHFDVLHLHEPLAPGASYACLAVGQPAKVGTFHRSGASIFYSVLGPLARGLAGRLQVRCAVSAEALSTAERALGGSYELIGNGVEVERFSRADPWPTRGPTVMFVGRHEKRKGLSVLLDAMSRLDNSHADFWVAGAG